MGLVSSSKMQARKRESSGQDSAIRNNAKQTAREKNKTYETLWKTNQINPLFDDSLR